MMREYGSAQGRPLLRGTVDRPITCGWIVGEVCALGVHHSHEAAETNVRRMRAG